MTVTEDIRYIGVDDHNTTLFESQYPLERGVSYNSYLMLLLSNFDSRLPTSFVHAC